MPEQELSLAEEIEQTKKELGIEEETEPKPEEQPKAEPQKTEPKVETPKPDETPEEQPKPKETKEEAVIPAWKVKIMEKQHAKKVEELLHQIEQSKQGKPTAETAKTEDDIETLAEELTAGLSDDQKTAQKTVIRKIVETARAGMKPSLPEDYEKIKAAFEQTEADKQFDTEFNAHIRPLVEKEYGSVSADILQNIKSQIKEKITSDSRLIMTPLTLVYSGSPEFRNLVEVEKPKKTAEPTRPGMGRETEVVDFDNMTEEKFLRLSDEDQERYADYMRKKERNSK